MRVVEPDDQLSICSSPKPCLINKDVDKCPSMLPSPSGSPQTSRKGAEKTTRPTINEPKQENVERNPAADMPDSVKSPTGIFPEASDRLRTPHRSRLTFI